MGSCRRGALALLLCLHAAACDGAPAATDAAVPVVDASAAVDAGGPVDAGPPTDFDGFVEWQMAYGGISGAALATVTANSIELHTFGLADRESDRAVDEHTLFIMASVSKTFAAVRAMQLVEEGRLDLDAPVEAYLGYPVVHPEHPDADISTRMLFAHVSGLEDDFLALADATYVGDPPISMDEFTRAYAIAGGSLYEPGHWDAAPLTRRSYCNAGYGVIGAVLEAAGEASLREQSEAAIFEPLALDGAGWFLADVDESRVATPYGFNGRTYSPLQQNGFAYYPASSLRISVTGLARYAQMLLRRGELDGTRILREESVDGMLFAQYPGVSTVQGLAFYRLGYNDVSYVGHSGSTFGGSIRFVIGLDRDYALILITNSDAHIRGRIPALSQGEEALDAILARMEAERGES